MPKRSADRPWVNREDRVDRAWPRDHLPSGGARRPRTDAAKAPTTPDEDAADAPGLASDGGPETVNPADRTKPSKPSKR
jgi:hypothetical protein